MAERPTRPPGMFQVAFDLEPVSDNWPPFSVERIWTKKTSAPYEVQVESIPFFLKELAFGDIIRARPDDTRRELVFDSLVRHSGNSTLRTIIKGNRLDVRSRLLEILRSAGCDWEFTSVDRHIAVNIPAGIDYRPIRNRLVEMMAKGEIEVEEAFISSGHQE